jgi:hypothetical protein
MRFQVGNESRNYERESQVMKQTLYAICAIVMLVSGVSCITESGGGSAAAVVTVQYVNPATFRDFSVQGRGSQYSSTVFTQEVTSTLTPVMGRRFPGDLLTLRFTDIDLAGRRTSVGGSSVRVVRNRTPARLSFDYVIRDKSGRIVANGSERLLDTGQRAAANAGRSGSLSTENRMLQRWLQSLSVPR